MLCDVMTVKHEDEDGLVYGTRWAERVAGLVLAVAGAIVSVATWAFAAIVPAPLVVLPGLSALLGLCVALSNRRFAFRRGSHTCAATIHTCGVIRRRREWNFTAIQMRRRFHWQLTRWLYVLVLVYNPQLAAAVVGFEDLQQPTQDANDFGDALPGDSEDNEPTIVCRSVRANVGKIRIECYENTLLVLTDRGNLRTGASAQ